MLRANATDPDAAIAEWDALVERMALLTEANDVLPLMYLRQDLGIALTAAVSLPFYLTNPGAIKDLPFLFDSFHRLIGDTVREPFLRRWLDCLSFFSGFPANGTMGAAMVYCLSAFHKDGAVLNAPIGGTPAVVDVLVEALERHGGELDTRRHVSRVDVSNGRAAGVTLKSGHRIRARQAVVSNATVWDTMRLLEDDSLSAAQRAWKEKSAQIPEHGSIMHLFLGVRGGDGLIESLEPSHLVVNDWERPLGDPQNVVTIFIPSLLDRSVAPEGRHCIHVYTAGSEPYDLWNGVKRGSDEYRRLKEERTQILWDAIERLIPDIRERVDVDVTGSPLTHERFLRRHKGTYGPALPAGEPLLPGLSTFPRIPQPGVLTPIDGLLRCGDSCFPGIGVPAAAASGAIAANTIVPVTKHIEGILTYRRYQEEHEERQAARVASQEDATSESEAAVEEAA